VIHAKAILNGTHPETLDYHHQAVSPPEAIEKYQRREFAFTCSSTYEKANQQPPIACVIPCRNLFNPPLVLGRGGGDMAYVQCRSPDRGAKPDIKSAGFSHGGGF